MMRHALGLLAAAAALAPTPLRETGRVALSEGWFAWVQPAHCDAEGNLFVMTLDPLDARSRGRRPPPEPRPRILGVSADGRKRTTFDPSGVPRLAGAEGVTTGAIAVSPDGTLHVLVWVPRGETSGRQHIVAFDNSGRYRSQVEVDPDEIAVSRLEVFGSGAFLLRGVRPFGGPRTVVMPAGGGLLEDVVPVADEGPEGVPTSRPEHLARGGDGRIYFLSERDDGVHVHAIAPTGLSEHAFRLAKAPRNHRLVGFLAAGRRLAAIHHEERETDENARVFAAVYDAALGERLSVYGPLPGMPLCYQSIDRRDQFTVFADGKLVTLSR